MKMTVENAKELVQEDEGLHINGNIKDIPTMFDGSWNYMSGQPGEESSLAIADNTSQVLDVAY